jgi:hypothetical protein
MSISRSTQTNFDWNHPAGFPQQLSHSAERAISAAAVQAAAGLSSAGDRSEKPN